MNVKLKIIAVAAIAASGTIVGISGHQKTDRSAFLLENVEALTNGEVTIEYDKCCVDDWQQNCVPNYMGPIKGKPVKC